MHRCRVTVNGPGAAVAAAVAELAAGSATPSVLAGARCIVLATPDGLDTWTALSTRHPEVMLGVECFEEFGDEYLQVVIENGKVTVMARTGLLPDDWGSFHDEDGASLDRELLRAAAGSVAEQRLRHDVGTPAHGLDIALTLGKALGRLCLRIERSVFDDPPRESLDAVIELAVFALWIGASGRSSDAGERDYDHALGLTRSMLHAGRSELYDRPGEASWMAWAQVLVGAASDVIGAACDCGYEPETHGHAVGAEHFGTPMEQLELSANSLLTTCLQTLALFDVHRGDAAARV